MQIKGNISKSGSKKRFINPHFQSVCIDMENISNLQRNTGYVIEVTDLNVETNDKNILVLEAHADDAVLSVGGVLYKLANEGWRINSYCLFSDYGIDQSEIRKLENQFVFQDIFHGRVEFGGFQDSSQRSDLEMNISYLGMLRKKITGMIEQIKPDMILVPMAIGAHIDHVFVRNAVISIVNKINSQVYFYEDYPYADNERFFYIDAVMQLKKFLPIVSTYWDISDSMQDKCEMAMIYLSQHQYLLDEITEQLQRFATAVRLEGQYSKSLPKEEKGYYERLWRMEKF